MKFSAHLEGLTLPNVLRILSVGKLSGIATGIHDNSSSKLVFSSGKIIYASSDNLSRLGYTLLKKKIISEEDLTFALVKQRESNEMMPLGSLLVELGLVKAEVVEENIINHIVKVFNDMLSWEDGLIHFKSQEFLDTIKVLKDGICTEILLLGAAITQEENLELDKELSYVCE